MSVVASNLRPLSSPKPSCRNEGRSYRCLQLSLLAATAAEGRTLESRLSQLIDAKSTVVLTANGVMRGAKPIGLFDIVNNAASICEEGERNCHISTAISITAISETAIWESVSGRARTSAHAHAARIKSCQHYHSDRVLLRWFCCVLWCATPFALGLTARAIELALSLPQHACRLSRSCCSACQRRLARSSS